jgi:hypothetical protein
MLKIKNGTLHDLHPLRLKKNHPVQENVIKTSNKNLGPAIMGTT